MRNPNNISEWVWPWEAWDKFQTNETTQSLYKSLRQSLENGGISFPFLASDKKKSSTIERILSFLVPTWYEKYVKSGVYGIKRSDEKIPWVLVLTNSQSMYYLMCRVVPATWAFTYRRSPLRLSTNDLASLFQNPYPDEPEDNIDVVTATCFIVWYAFLSVTQYSRPEASLQKFLEFRITNGLPLFIPGFVKDLQKNPRTQAYDLLENIYGSLIATTIVGNSTIMVLDEKDKLPDVIHLGGKNK